MSDKTRLAIAAREQARKQALLAPPPKKAKKTKKAAPVEVIPQPAELVELASEPEA